MHLGAYRIHARKSRQELFLEVRPKHFYITPSPSIPHIVITVTAAQQTSLRMASNNDFQLFSSLRYDTLLLSSVENSRSDLNFITPSPFYMLAYHRDRMVEAAQHFDFNEVEKKLSDGHALHNELQSRVDEWLRKNGQDVPLKVCQEDHICTHAAC